MITNKALTTLVPQNTGIIPEMTLENPVIYPNLTHNLKARKLALQVFFTLKYEYSLDNLTLDTVAENIEALLAAMTPVPRI